MNIESAIVVSAGQLTSTARANLTQLLFHAQHDRAWDELPVYAAMRQLAYIIATAYHETAHDFTPRDERGRGKGKAYGQSVAFAGTGSRVTEWRTYYGRGLVQLTWLHNYAKAAVALGVDFVAAPDLAKQWPHCYNILASGMREGWVTGVRLGQFLNSADPDYYNARRVVNGTDKADLIASYARRYELLLRKAGGIQ